MLCSLVAGGLLLTLGTTQTDQPWLGWASLVPLFLCIRYCGGKVAFLGGTLWGLSFALSFKATSVAGLTEFSWPAVVFLALVSGLYACGGALASRRRGFDPVLLALAWCAVELATVPLGFKHGLLLDTQGASPAIVIIGKLGGFVFASFVVTFFVASILAILAEARFRSAGLRVLLAAFRSPGRVLPRDSWIATDCTYDQTLARAPPAA